MFVVFAEKMREIHWVCMLYSPIFYTFLLAFGGVFTPEISQLVGNIMGYLRWKETILHQSEIDNALIMPFMSRLYISNGGSG